MRLLIICLLALMQTACASMFEAYEIGDGWKPSRCTTFANCPMYSMAREKRDPEMAKKFDKVVSDDIVLLEVKDASGKVIATGQAR